MATAITEKASEAKTTTNREGMGGTQTDKVGIVLLCRYNSSRLPGKILLPLGDRPVLQYLFDRLAPLQLPICVATSTGTADDPIAAYCQQQNITCFRGDLQNVALRFLQAAKAQGWTYAVRITGDSVFIDPQIVKYLVALAGEDRFDLVNNRQTKMYPVGQTVEVVRVKTMEQFYPRFATPDDFEHVTHYFYTNEHVESVRMCHATNPDGNQRNQSLAIDTEADFQRAKKVLAQLGPENLKTASYLEIAKIYERI